MCQIALSLIILVSIILLKNVLKWDFGKNLPTDDKKHV